MKSSTTSTADKLIIIFFLGMLILGVFIVPDYGEPWDHLLRYRSGWTTIEIYRNPFIERHGLDYGPSDSRYYGPFVVAAANLVARILQALNVPWDPLTSHRYVYFVLFQLGVLAFYHLCKYFVSEWPTLAATMLFATQPLLFGNAPANAKDTPFLALFIIAVLAGLRMLDSLPTAQQTQPPPAGKLKDVLSGEWRTLPKTRRRLILILFAAWVLLFAAVLICYRPLTGLVSTLTANAYHAAPGTLADTLFSWLTPDRLHNPLSSYQAKALSAFTRFTIGFFLLALAALLYSLRRQLPASRAHLAAHIPAFLRNRRIILAGIALGLASSVRVLGPAAGGLVLLVLLLRRKGKGSLWPFVYYAVIALLTMYLAWPYLWLAPIQHFRESLSIMSSFPHLPRVLFNGQYYPSDALPISYLPLLMSIQFTEPVMLLALLGMALVLLRWVRWKRDHSTDTSKGTPALWLAAALWLFLPLMLVWLAHPSIYDNFRQFFFITPPLFLFGAAAIEAAFDWLRRKWLQLLFALLILFPGFYHIATAHPYEYVYYNSYISGVNGAVDRFHLDYLGLSAAEAVDYLNHNAEPNATVLIIGPYYESSYFLRPDLKPIDARDHPGIGPRMTDAYWLILNTGKQSSLEKDNAIDLFQVKLDQALLVTVRKYTYP